MTDAKGALTRADLMAQHEEARRRREAAVLDSHDYRAAAGEIARIEVAIAALEEADPEETVRQLAAAAASSAAASTAAKAATAATPTPSAAAGKGKSTP